MNILRINNEINRRKTCQNVTNCKSFADYARDYIEDGVALSGDDYSDYYSHLHRTMQKIADAKME